MFRGVEEEEGKKIRGKGGKIDRREKAIMPFFKNHFYIGTMLRFITGKKLDMWDNSLYYINIQDKKWEA